MLKYRLLPEHPFPEALNDVIHAYLSLLNTFGPRASSVVLMGDSAGANLATALTLFLAMTGGRLPDRLVLTYPGSLISTLFVPAYLLPQPAEGLGRCCAQLFIPGAHHRRLRRNWV